MKLPGNNVKTCEKQVFIELVFNFRTEGDIIAKIQEGHNLGKKFQYDGMNILTTSCIITQYLDENELMIIALTGIYND